MANLSIKGLDDAVFTELKVRAAQQRTTIRALVIEAVNRFIGTVPVNAEGYDTLLGGSVVRKNNLKKRLLGRKQPVDCPDDVMAPTCIEDKVK